MNPHSAYKIALALCKNNFFIFMKNNQKFFKTVSVVILVFTGFLFVSCHSSSESVPSGVAWPLKVGDSWQFRYLGYDDQGAQLYDYNDSIFFSSDTMINGETWFILNNSTVAFANRNDGLWRDVLTNGSAPLLVVKYPTAVGDTYNIGSSKVTVISTNEPLSLPCGNFICIKLEIRGTDVTNYVQEMYISPNFGQVKSIRYNVTPSGTPSNETLEYYLINYSLK